jgi:hypothetical protein
MVTHLSYVQFEDAELTDMEYWGNWFQKFSVVFYFYGLVTVYRNV